MKQTQPVEPKRAIRGFSAMNPKLQKNIASQGGKAIVKQRGKAWLRKIASVGGKNSHKGSAK